ncbi:sialate O-acetylesterase [Mucisphaera calidilacus]|uniref:Glycosyl hydrolases family 2, sugar binding domain n=1 Tax=Mucisphaera calidilacus TaxID=2527982 RepID=A0A518BZQ2_9BACT|nr:sialate O-acetylesterase [Mucisphaera calidilacus]QDU72452.1 Glycosyl hydrolases family 2, sugar binding domain [Mucisphaera calidilacus]
MKRIFLSVVLLVLMTSSVAVAELVLPAVFSDHMVLQRERPVPVWGKADADQAVTVQLMEADNPRPLAQAFTVADVAGHWRAELPAQAAGGPYRLVVRGGDEIVLEDVYLGEVWLCSGQSNMEWPVRLTKNAAAEIAGSADPLLRHFDVPRTVAGEPQWDTDASWTMASPETVPGYTAVGYYFARQLRNRLGVAVGLVNSSWGGTRIEPWMPPRMLTAYPDVAADLELLEERLAAYKADPSAAEAMAEAMRSAYEAEVSERQGLATRGGVGLEQRWMEPGHDVSGWGTMSLPVAWERAGVEALEAYNGVVWFRREVTIPDAWVGRELALNLGPIDDVDSTYVNGELVGTTDFSTRNSWTVDRRYAVSGDVVTNTTLTVVVRVGDWYGDGGISGESSQMWLSLEEGGEKVSLAGPWLYQKEETVVIGQERPAAPPGEPSLGGATARTPTALYNGMICPVKPYGIRGAIWYQGESNASEATRYRSLMPGLIEGWRGDWNDAEMPFGIVQLANFMRERETPGDSAWAELRDAQLHTAKTMEKVGLAVTIDIGEANDIHPRNKQDVGARLASWAMAEAYGQPGAGYSGPMFAKAFRQDSRFVVTFDLFGSQLAVRGGGKPVGFAVAGEDRVWHRAEARIEGDRVEVWCDAVPEPVALRYGWADNPTRANLVNAQGLPASPFRTDDWNTTK